MYHDFELEQIIQEVSTEWNIRPTEKEVVTLIELYRRAERSAEMLREQIQLKLLEEGNFISGDEIVDVKPFEEVMEDYFREKYFMKKYKGLSVSSYFKFDN